jgi:hypothetical protein
LSWPPAQSEAAVPLVSADDVAARSWERQRAVDARSETSRDSRVLERGARLAGMKSHSSKWRHRPSRAA